MIVLCSWQFYTRTGSMNISHHNVLKNKDRYDIHVNTKTVLTLPDIDAYHTSARGTKNQINDFRQRYSSNDFVQQQQVFFGEPIASRASTPRIPPSTCRETAWVTHMLGQNTWKPGASTGYGGSLAARFPAARNCHTVSQSCTSTSQQI